MKPYQRQFIEFALNKQVLKFGEFTLKSGRKSPYFFNAGLFNTGRDLALLGRFYAEALVDSGIEFDLLFGPAYKGIPIATTTAVALAEHHDKDLPYCFNRKEAKDHGEGGNLVGSALQGRVMLVDDVITAGTAIRESMEIIQANGATLAGVLISLDRQERGFLRSMELFPALGAVQNKAVGGAVLGVLRHLPAELQGDLAETIQGLDTDSPLSTPEESLDDLVACVAEIAEVTRGFTIKE